LIIYVCIIIYQIQHKLLVRYARPNTN